VVKQGVDNDGRAHPSRAGLGDQALGFECLTAGGDPVVDKHDPASISTTLLRSWTSDRQEPSRDDDSARRRQRG
jgi:hypothetical protein